MRRTQAQRREETRGALLDAATRVFAERGYHAAGVAEVAKVAGVSTGALYAHFGSKGDLLIAVIEHNIPRWMRGYARAIGEAESLDDRVEALAAAAADRISRVPQGWWLLIDMWGAAVRDPDLRPHFAERYGEIRAAVAQELERAFADEGATLGVPAQQLAAVVVAIVDGLALQKIADPDGVSDETLRFALRSVVAAGRGDR